MANINTSTVFGQFKAGTTPFESLSESNVSLECAAGKDPVLALFDLTSASDDTQLSVLNAQGKSVAEITLTAGMLNIVPLTTKDIKTADGKINFSVASHTGIKAGAVVYTPVINN